MANPDTKMRSITGMLTENKLAARTDDYTFNVTYRCSKSHGAIASPIRLRWETATNR